MLLINYENANIVVVKKRPRAAVAVSNEKFISI